ncbi:MAG: EF-hand domain-containing protein [Rubripirellula sp.]
MLKLATRSLLILVVSLTAASGRAADVVEEHLQAVGGAKAISAIKSIHRSGGVSGTSSYGPFEGTVDAILDTRGDRIYSAMKLTGYSRELGWDGDSGWIRDTQAGLRDVSSEEAIMERFLVVPSPLVALREEFGAAALKHGADVDFNGKNCAVVTLVGRPVEFFVNRESSLLEGVKLSQQSEMIYESFIRVDGIQFPKQITLKVASPETTLVYQFTSTKLGEELDASKFLRPGATAEPEEPHAATPSKGFSGEQIIRFLDKSGDGRISKSEASAELKANFPYIDANGDGLIDLEEANAVAAFASRQPVDVESNSKAERVPSPKFVVAKTFVESMDRNKDGAINKSEAPEDLRLFFEEYDGNADGKIDVSEAQAIADYLNKESGVRSKAALKEPGADKGQVTAKQLVQSMDKDRDGSISKAEAPDELKKSFQYIDVNGDGEIDVEEAQAMANYVNQSQGG